MILAVIFLSFALSSCEEELTYDITVKNSCEWNIQVNITQSTSKPSYHSIAPGSSRRFDDNKDSSYYLHVTTEDPSAPKSAQENYYESMRIYKDDTWIIEWTGSAYRVTYTL